MNENNTHPLTETDAAELWEVHIPERKTHYLGWRTFPLPSRRYFTTIIRAAFDAGREHERAEDDRPWEPLTGPPRVGDEVRRDFHGVTTIGVASGVDGDGDPFTAEGYLIGLRNYGTWYVRRPVQELPMEDGAVIVPADGCEYIATNEGMAHALVHLGGKWYGGASRIDPEQITPGTWRAA